MICYASRRIRDRRLAHGYTRLRNLLLTQRSQLASMRRITKERRLLVAAARCGLKLIKARSATDPGANPYCLRALNDATFVVGRLPGDALGLVKARGGRDGVSWLSLRDVEKFLSTWTGSAPKERESPRKKRLRRVDPPHSLLRDMPAICRDGSSPMASTIPESISRRWNPGRLIGQC